MSAATLTREEPALVDDIDALLRDLTARPRVGLSPYVFTGPGDEHLVGQRCHVLQHDVTTAVVVFSCGCRADVSRWSRQLA
jgi:hypothetical protein